MQKKKKRKCQKHLLVYVDDWTVQKGLVLEQKLQKLLESPNFQIKKKL